MVKIEKSSQLTRIELSPNRSVSWREAKLIITFMICVVMIIAIAWTFVGAWVVLPFAGLEVGLFALLMYKVTYFTYYKQVVTFYADKVTIEAGVNRRKSSNELNTYSLSLHYNESDQDWHAPVATLVNDQQRIRIGEFLNKQDLQLLKQYIQEQGVPVVRNKWWQD